jgi:putative copper resistance protein D
VVILGLMIGRLAWSRWWSQRKSSWLEIAAGVVAVALTVSMAWTGHAAATGGADFWYRVPADATHLFAVSIWPTGLLPFALFLGHARRIEDASRLQPVLTVARRFSTVSFLAVWVLIASGIINAYFIVGSFEALFTTDYGRLLCLKLFLFLAMLGIASWNRYRLLPLLLLNARTSETSLAYRLLHRLQSFVLTEFGVAMVIVVVVSILGTTAPPR